MNKTDLLKRQSAIEVEVIGLREQRAAMAADLAHARAAFETEKRGGVAALVGKLKYSPDKMQAARLKLDLLPDALAEMDRKILTAAAPLAEVEHALARLEAEQWLAEAVAAAEEVKADAIALVHKHARALELARRVNDVPQSIMRGYEKSGYNNPLADVSHIAALRGELVWYGCLK